MTRRLTILVSGMVAAVPAQGGATWAVLQYVLGFARLGHDVYFVESLDADALRPPGASLSASANAGYCQQVMSRYGHGSRWALMTRDGSETAGMAYEEVRRVAREATVLLDISGTLTDQELVQGIPIRIYLDVDPAFTQLWHHVQGVDMGFDGHTHLLTVGLNIGRPQCPVPTGGRIWSTSVQPVVLERWPVAGRIVHDGFTTVANWRGYGSIELDSVLYGQKAHSLRKFFALPRLTPETLMLALAIHADERADVKALRENGWTLLDPGPLTESPAAYQSFIQGSKAEFGVAKSGYVESRSGWFSDRSICYLASGRPVLAQETGFSNHLPTGAGLLAFDTLEDILRGIEQINGDYPRHAAAARALAEEHFDSDRVLSRLLQDVGAAP